MLRKSLILAGLMAISAVSQAALITISEINIETKGDNERLKWDADSRDDFSFNLNAGEQKKFWYGTFSTKDFSFDKKDLNDNNDRLFVDMFITPPDPSAQVTKKARPDAFLNKRGKDRLLVNFRNNWMNYAVVDGVSYSIKFHDVMLRKDGEKKLQATIKAVSVPEPGTLALLGAGLLGLGAARRKQKA